MSHIHRNPLPMPGAPRVSCMGGFCASDMREQCENYHRTEARHWQERMCLAGRADEFVRRTPSTPQHTRTI